MIRKHEPAAIATAPPPARDDVRAKILAAATVLIGGGGRDALTTRALAAAAGVQAPTIYRIFGDKGGLLDAVAEHGFTTYLAAKFAMLGTLGPDPVENFRIGWSLHVEFGLANPALFSLMYGDPRPGVTSPAAEIAFSILHERIRALAAAGRLRVPEARAAGIVHAAGTGTVFALLGTAPPLRDPRLSHDARDAAFAAIALDAPAAAAPGPAAAAIALRALLAETAALTSGERHVLEEWLDRIASAPPS